MSYLLKGTHLLKLPTLGQKSGKNLMKKAILEKVKNYIRGKKLFSSGNALELQKIHYITNKFIIGCP